MRIVSLVPSATELLFALGLGDEVVAVTHECDYPPEAAELPHITYSVIPPAAPSPRPPRRPSKRRRRRRNPHRKAPTRR